MASMNGERKLSFWRKWFGIGLVLLSGVWFACLVAVPFLGFTLETTALLGGVFFVLMEVTFYAGVFVVGKQLLSRYWSAIRSKLRIRPRQAD